MEKKDWPRALRDSLPLSLASTVIVMTQTHFTRQQHVLFAYTRTFLTRFPFTFLMFSIFARFGYCGAKEWATPDALISWRRVTICFSGLLLFDFLFPLPWHGEPESLVFALAVLFVFLCLMAPVVSIRDALRERK